MNLERLNNSAYQIIADKGNCGKQSQGMNYFSTRVTERMRRKIASHVRFGHIETGEENEVVNIKKGLDLTKAQEEAISPIATCVSCPVNQLCAQFMTRTGIRDLTQDDISGVDVVPPVERRLSDVDYDQLIADSSF